jgi:hypothetical protein
MRNDLRNSEDYWQISRIILKRMNTLQSTTQKLQFVVFLSHVGPREAQKFLARVVPDISAKLTEQEVKLMLHALICLYVRRKESGIEEVPPIKETRPLIEELFQILITQVEKPPLSFKQFLLLIPCGINYYSAMAMNEGENLDELNLEKSSSFGKRKVKEVGITQKVLNASVLDFLLGGLVVTGWVFVGYWVYKRVTKGRGESSSS